jgi:hypothetical protein
MEYIMNKFTTLKEKIEQANRELIFKQFSGQQLLNKLEEDKQNGIVVGDDYLDEIREEYFNSDFDSSNEEIENRLNEIGKEEEYKEYLENIIRDLKLEIED